MKYFQFVLIVVSLLVILEATLDSRRPNYIFPCYYVYEPEYLKPESIPAFDLCTHIILIGPCIGQTINSSFNSVSMKPYNCQRVLTKLTNLKSVNPDLKVMFSIGTGDSRAMENVTSSLETMNEYADSSIKIALDYKFDGIDLDWEYPCGASLKMKFTLLLDIYRSKFMQHKLDLLLSSAIGAGINTLKECFDLEGLTRNLDFINVMCYDYNTIWNTKTAYASPLFARPEETGYDATLNTNYTINYLIDNNVPRSKIVVGLNSGGHTFQLVDPGIHGFHAPVLGVGYSEGWSSYPQLCRIMRSENGVGVYDKVAEVLYAYYDDQWTNTGDVRSATAKTLWAKEMDLAGVFTFSLNWDDVFDVCGHGVTFPIHRAIRKHLFAN